MQRSKHSVKTVAIILTAILAWATDAARPDPLAAAMSPADSVATFIATDFSFTGPDRLPAGMTTLRIENRGNDLHQIQLIQLTDGKTAADFQAAFKDDPMGMNLPGWVKYLGGPNAVIPGESTTATVNLEPGDYLITCLIPDNKGISHAAHGMVKPLIVTKADNPMTEAPAADREIEFGDFVFIVPKPFTAGKQTIRVVNKGMQAHEVLLVALPPDVSVKDFGNYFLPDAPAPNGPPPGKPIGGVSGIGSGATAYFTAELAPGRYGLICFFTDKGQVHFTKGMMINIEVK